MITRQVSTQTKKNWLLDAGLFFAALAASLSGIYFLFFPSGGFMGGRNPAYGMVLLFSRETWDLLHTWTGVAMIAVAVAHLAIHWSWVTGAALRVLKEVTGRCACINPRARFNIFVDSLVALGFLLSAVSGVYFLFAGSSHGGTLADPIFLFSRTTWDLVHTWSSVVFIAAAVVHLAIHWRWVVNVTRRIFSGFNHQPAQVAAAKSANI